MKISEAGKTAVDELARKHGFSPQAVESMLISVALGNASMAQFQHPEFGGSGQWMRGGMTMVSDMFNNTLKSRVDGLCGDLSGLITSHPDMLVRESGGLYGINRWWGQDFGQPSSSGGQNNARYVWFSGARRLAVEDNGRVTVYDTLDHQIGGFSQQQSHGSSMSFTSQHGRVDLAKLPIVSGGDSREGQKTETDRPAQTETAQPTAGQSQSQSSGPARQPEPQVKATPAEAKESGLDIFATLERLAELHQKGILTDDEFSAKKAELLSRL